MTRNEKIAEMKKNGYTARELSKMFNISNNRVYQICKSQKEKNKYESLKDLPARVRHKLIQSHITSKKQLIELIESENGAGILRRQFGKKSFNDLQRFVGFDIDGEFRMIETEDFGKVEILVVKGVVMTEEQRRRMNKTIGRIGKEQKMNEWILIEKEKPEPCTPIYVTLKDLECGDNTPAYGYVDENGEWNLYNYMDGHFIKGFKILAWMPLPKTYKENDDVEVRY